MMVLVTTLLVVLVLLVLTMLMLKTQLISLALDHLDRAALVLLQWCRVWGCTYLVSEFLSNRA
jgi:hypothetical protein